MSLNCVAITVCAASSFTRMVRTLFVWIVAAWVLARVGMNFELGMQVVGGIGMTIGVGTGVGKC